MKIIIVAVAISALSTTQAMAVDQACRDKLIIAGKMGLLQDMQMSEAGVTFIVDEDVWSGMSYRAKQGLVKNINCGMLDEGKRFNPIIFRGDRTNKVVGKDSWGKLTIP